MAHYLPAFINLLLSHFSPESHPLHAVFLLHGIMSSASEANYDLSLSVNVESICALATALRQTHPGVRVIYASSLAVYGAPFPNPPGCKIPESWLPTPQSTYGAHKLMVETYLTEMHRRGFLDVFIVRFPTIAIRPGSPTGAASSFWSGIIREPMNGQECVVPVVDRSLRTFVASPRTVGENLVKVLGVAVSVQEMRDALERYGGGQGGVGGRR
ncbi:hypothetical protein N0V88_008014 [Collariella sp. IMI 366227]|nr:hypothetical protein N0V88_008014 [Collariella sp. IMI 366227]